MLVALLLCMDADLAVFTPAIFSHAGGAADGVMELMGGSWPPRMRVGWGIASLLVGMPVGSLLGAS